MKACIVVSPKNMVIEDVPIPRCPTNGVLLKTLKACICNSTDLHEYEGIPLTYNVTYPHRIGHEHCGEVIEVGKNLIKDYSIGDRLAFSCQGGGFAEYTTIIPKNLCVAKLPDTISDEEGAICETFHGAMVQTVYPVQIKKGEKVLVIGQGPMGLNISQLVQCFGAVTASIDLYEFRLRKAKELGVRYTYNRAKMSRFEIEEAIKKDLGEIDVVISAIDMDLSKENDSFILGMNVLRYGGRFTGLAVGVKSVNHTINPRDLQAKEIRFGRLLHEFYGSSAKKIREVQNKVFGQAVKWVEEGKVNLKSLITHRIPLEAVEKGLFLCKENPDEVLKVIIYF